MRSRLLAATTAFTLLGGGAALAAPSQADRQFAMQAARSGLAEVQAGQLATQKATSTHVRQFGQMLVNTIFSPGCPASIRAD